MDPNWNTASVTGTFARFSPFTLTSLWHALSNMSHVSTSDWLINCESQVNNTEAIRCVIQSKIISRSNVVACLLLDFTTTVN